MKSGAGDMKAVHEEYQQLPGDDVEAAAPAPAKRPLTLLPLIAIIFFEVSGGPFGTEVRSLPSAAVQ